LEMKFVVPLNEEDEEDEEWIEYWVDVIGGWGSRSIRNVFVMCNQHFEQQQ
jgi:hypothetical protein